MVGKPFTNKNHIGLFGETMEAEGKNNAFEAQEKKTRCLSEVFLRISPFCFVPLCSESEKIYLLIKYKAACDRERLFFAPPGRCTPAVLALDGSKIGRMFHTKKRWRGVICYIILNPTYGDF